MSKSDGTVGLLYLVGALLLIMLKLNDVIHWSWTATLAPLWLLAVFAISFCMIVVLFTVLVDAFRRALFHK